MMHDVNAGNNDPQWFVLYTSPRAEKKVVERIRCQGVDAWLPLHSTPRVWSDRVKIVDVPLFHSYVFVKCAEIDLFALLRINGVVRIIYYDGKPAVIRQNEIDAVKDFLEQSANHTIMVGDEAEILAGPMKHISGEVTMINKTSLVLYIKQLGAVLSVDLAQVAPLKRLK